MKKLFYLIFFIIFFGLVTSCASEQAIIVKNDIEEPARAEVSTADTKDTFQTEENKKILVYVGGHVKTPGIYELPEGSRAFEFINAAGGTDISSDDLNINPAAIVKDGDRIIVSDISDGTEGESLIYPDTTSTSDGKVNINEADKAMLMTIPGIGEVRADAIIAYREKNGFFKTPEDIMSVSGIKEGTFEKIRDHIRVS